ncbi:hypothetical protein ACFQ0M_48585 [Kitasatospora aburaviensis]|uniref:Uncharacterized protein n=1 Tax=Kitasatospora aburaviensis TaxID=67265 RepID=A0ABW1F4L8_9ACTN
MTDLDFDDPLNDPANLWPDPAEGQAPEQPRPPVWVWAEMEPDVRRRRFRELAVWTNWLTATFPKVQQALPGCWYQHADVREHLTALYAAYVRAYIAPSPGMDAAEATWLSHLHALTPHLSVAKCASGHETPSTRTKAGATLGDVDAYLAHEEFGTAPATAVAQELGAELLAARQEPPL